MAYLRFGKKMCTSCPKVLSSSSGKGRVNMGAQNGPSNGPKLSSWRMYRYLSTRFVSDSFRRRRTAKGAYLIFAKTLGIPLIHPTAASQKRSFHLTDSHRKREVTSCRYRFPTFNAASVPRRSRSFKIAAMSSMISVGSSSRGKGTRFCGSRRREYEK